MAGQMSRARVVRRRRRLCFSTALYLKFAVSPWIGLELAATLAARSGAPDGPTRFSGAKCRGSILHWSRWRWPRWALHIISMFVSRRGHGLSIPSKARFANLQFSSKLGFCYAALAFSPWCRSTSCCRSLAAWLRLYCDPGDERSAAALGIDVVLEKSSPWRSAGGWTALVGPVYANYVLSSIRNPCSRDALDRPLLFSLCRRAWLDVRPAAWDGRVGAVDRTLARPSRRQAAGVHLIVTRLLILVMRLRRRAYGVCVRLRAAEAE